MAAAAAVRSESSLFRQATVRTLVPRLVQRLAYPPGRLWLWFSVRRPVSPIKRTHTLPTRRHTDALGSNDLTECSAAEYRVELRLALPIEYTEVPITNLHSPLNSMHYVSSTHLKRPKTGDNVLLILEIHFYFPSF